MAVQLQTRTSVDGNSPVSGSLQPGQLAVEMGNPTRLWVGVPVGLDATLQKKLYDSSDLSAYVTLNTAQEITGPKTFRTPLTLNPTLAPPAAAGRIQTPDVATGTPARLQVAAGSHGAAGGVGAGVEILGGSGGGGGGDVVLAPGSGPIPGELILRALPVVAQATVDAVWNNAGVLNIGAGGTAGGGLVDAPVDTFLYGRKDAIWVQAMPLVGGQPAAVATDPGTNVIITAGNATGIGQGSGLNLRGGSATGAAVSIFGGASLADPNPGGDVAITGGAGYTNGNGGTVIVMGGAGVGAAGVGGDVILNTSDPVIGSARGSIRLQNLPLIAPTDPVANPDTVWNNAGVLNIGAGGAAGGGMAEPVGAGAWGRLETAAWAPVLPLLGGTLIGPLRVEAGFTVAPQDSALAGTNVAINAGDGNLLGGYLDLNAGDSVSADGGGVTINGGATAGATSTPGTVIINAGRNTNPANTAAGAGVTINGGTSQLGVGGQVLITAGESLLAGGGSLRLVGGPSNGAGQNGGNVNINGGASLGGGGAPGNIIMSSLPTVAPAVSNAIWRDPVTNALMITP